jgi:hypothetical protein
MRESKDIQIIRWITLSVLGLGFYVIYLNLLDIIYLTDKELIADAWNDITKIASASIVYSLWSRITILEHKSNE